MTRSGGKKDQRPPLHPHRSRKAASSPPASTCRSRRPGASCARPSRPSRRRFAAVEAALKKGKLDARRPKASSPVPRGFEALKDGPLDGAVRLKSFIVEEPLPDKLITIAEARRSAIVDFAGRALPLLKFGWAALDG